MGHHVEIVTKCKTVNEALFFFSRTIGAGYSRNVLVNMLEADLFHKEGTALTNNTRAAPSLTGRRKKRQAKLIPSCKNGYALQKGISLCSCSRIAMEESQNI